MLMQDDFSARREFERARNAASAYEAKLVKIAKHVGDLIREWDFRSLSVRQLTLLLEQYASLNSPKFSHLALDNLRGLFF